MAGVWLQQAAIEHPLLELHDSKVVAARSACNAPNEQLWFSWMRTTDREDARRPVTLLVRTESTCFNEISLIKQVHRNRFHAH